MSNPPTSAKETWSHTGTHCLLTALLACGIGFFADGVVAMGRPATTVAISDEQGVEVLTRGPVHEAFAGVVTFNPTPGVIVPQAPPAAIDEVPPDVRPEGENIAWIPGYWAWDDERNDFLWVSGVWRALPPGRQWVAGYWGTTRQGTQWTAGYWADAAMNETVYLPAPPATVEEGPNIAAMSAEQSWTPGCWIWHHNRYAWRPGYWADGRLGWVWMPAYYIWTPRGYVWVDGYWDYAVERRGVLFAPIYFAAGVYGRRGYQYSPSIVINLALFSDHLFLRPSYEHYYFGDYYAAGYASAGFYASFSYQSSRHGYDPIYAHQRWQHREDRDWERRVQTTYERRRDHVEARPPRTWADQRSISRTAPSKDTSRIVATVATELPKSEEGTVRLQRVAKEEKLKILQRGQGVQNARKERRALEAVTDTAPDQPARPAEPSRGKLSRSPIVAKSPDELGKDHAPPSPHRVPQPDLQDRRNKPEASVPEARSEPDRPAKRDTKPEPDRGRDKPDENDNEGRGKNKKGND